MTPLPEERYLIPDHVMVRELGGEAVLLDLEGEMYYGLDEVGARFWILLSESGSVGGAVDTLLDEFNVSREVLEADISSLLRELLNRGLVEPAAE